MNNFTSAENKNMPVVGLTDSDFVIKNKDGAEASIKTKCNGDGTYSLDKPLSDTIRENFNNYDE